MTRCSWCDEPATVALVGGANADHHACATHEDEWGRLYRRAVRLRTDEPVIDLRDPTEVRLIG